MLILLSDFRKKPVSRLVRREGIEIGVEDKTVKKDECHEREDNAVKKPGTVKDICELGIKENSPKCDGKYDPALEDGDDFGA